VCVETDDDSCGYINNDDSMFALAARQDYKQ